MPGSLLGAGKIKGKGPAPVLKDFTFSGKMCFYTNNFIKTIAIIDICHGYNRTLGEFINPLKDSQRK